MSDQFYKTMKRKEYSQAFEKRRKDAVNLMRQYTSENNADEFLAKFLNHLDESIPE